LRQERATRSYQATRTMNDSRPSPVKIRRMCPCPWRIQQSGEARRVRDYAGGGARSHPAACRRMARARDDPRALHDTDFQVTQWTLEGHTERGGCRLARRIRARVHARASSVWPRAARAPHGDDESSTLEHLASGPALTLARSLSLSLSLSLFLTLSRSLSVPRAGGLLLAPLADSRRAESRVPARPVSLPLPLPLSPFLIGGPVRVRARETVRGAQRGVQHASRAPARPRVRARTQ
jgi:hypothetical protein